MPTLWPGCMTVKRRVDTEPAPVCTCPGSSTSYTGCSMTWHRHTTMGWCRWTCYIKSTNDLDRQIEQATAKQAEIAEARVVAARGRDIRVQWDTLEIDARRDLVKSMTHSIT